MQPMTVWKLKMAASIYLDFMDMVLGAVPVLGHGMEFIGTPAAMLLWGWRGGFYGLEVLDVTNMADAFAPTASIIGWTKKAEYEERQREWEARNRPPSSGAAVIIPAE